MRRTRGAGASRSAEAGGLFGGMKLLVGGEKKHQRLHGSRGCGIVGVIRTTGGEVRLNQIGLTLR